MILPFLNGDFDSANLTWGALDGTAAPGTRRPRSRPGRWSALSMVWLWIMAWSSWGVDTCATFAPEYKDTVNDTRLALRSACIFTFVVYILLPLGLVGGVGEETRRCVRLRRRARDSHAGSEGLTDFFVVVIVRSFLISMNTATADGGRALYGIARDHMTIKQLYHLNRHHVPGRAMTIDMVLEHLLRAADRELVRRAGGEQHRVRARAFLRDHRLHPVAARSASLAAADRSNRRLGCRSATCSR